MKGFYNKMKILVFSDSHRYLRNMTKVLQTHMSDTDLIIHLGDNISDTTLFTQLCPHIANINISGNCDFSMSNIESTFKLGKTDITAFACHGHYYNVKNGTDSLLREAKKQNAKIALFGHTHISHLEERDGILLINPGSISQPRGIEGASYAIINIENNIISPSIIYKID